MLEHEIFFDAKFEDIGAGYSDYVFNSYSYFKSMKIAVSNPEMVFAYFARFAEKTRTVDLRIYSDFYLKLFFR